MTLSLSARQMRLVQEAANSVPVRRREEFLARVKAHLAKSPSDSAVAAAINAQLDALPVFFCDGAALHEETD